MAPLADAFGFVPLPLPALAMIVALTLSYLAAVELAKHALGAFQRVSFPQDRTLPIPAADPR
ncbi:hypothetical protein X551_02012 [Methylibium sp. T29]|nr:hypothetical protein X551_02012 [Methylibium sp. T29]EWS59530.1 hypothetical protein Y694_02656 [Methylibium sp. T29-B]